MKTDQALQENLLVAPRHILIFIMTLVALSYSSSYAEIVDEGTVAQDANEFTCTCEIKGAWWGLYKNGYTPFGDYAKLAAVSVSKGTNFRELSSECKEADGKYWKLMDSTFTQLSGCTVTARKVE